MIQIFKNAARLAMIAAATATFAQENAEAPAEGATTEQAAPSDEAAPAEESGLALGETVVETQIGQPYIEKTYDDWARRCLRTENPDEDPCTLYQLLKDGDGNSVAEISLFRLPSGGKAVAGATLIVPLETLLTAQAVIRIDGGGAKRYPYSFCNQVGCYARIGMTAADVSAFKAGANAKLYIVPFAAPDQQVELNISLKGFTAGYEETQVAKQ